MHRYVAASAPVHVLESTRYLGRAIQALLLQDFGVAKHLAYYAELRSTMGVLATEGIGVFDKWHVVLVDNYTFEKVPQKVPTHEFVWEAFDLWTREVSSSKLLSDAVVAWGLSLGEFCSATFSGATLHPYIQAVLQEWGVDLQTYVEDRRSRNVASYRPAFAAITTTRGRITPIEFVQEFWALFEPSTIHSFEFVDRPMFRGCYRAMRSQVVTKGSVLSRLRQQGITQAQSIAQYVGQPDLKKPLVFKLAAVKIGRDPAEHAMAMMSRAMLLVRIAIGSCSALLADAGFGIGDVRQWLQAITDASGITRGPFVDGAELWDDVEDAMSELKALLPLPDQHELIMQNSSVVATLQQCERLSVWGLAR